VWRFLGGERSGLFKQLFSRVSEKQPPKGHLSSLGGVGELGAEEKGFSPAGQRASPGGIERGFSRGLLRGVVCLYRTKNGLLPRKKSKVAVRKRGRRGTPAPGPRNGLLPPEIIVLNPEREPRERREDSAQPAAWMSQGGVGGETVKESSGTSRSQRG